MKLHLGCGWRNFGSDWVHVDNGNYEHLDYKADVYNLSMIDDGSVDLIYASHIIAYFDRKEITHTLEEWKRVLKPNGVLRLATPDFQTMCLLYTSLDEGLVGLGDIVGPLYGKMDMDGVNIFHKTTYDFKSLKKVLVDCGFSDVKRYDWRETEHSEFDDHSQAYIPHMDKENGTLISLNVEATK